MKSNGGLMRTAYFVFWFGTREMNLRSNQTAITLWEMDSCLRYFISNFKLSVSFVLYVGRCFSGM